MVEISRSMKARKNNAKGHMFERYINAACAYYKRTGQANRYIYVKKRFKQNSGRYKR